MLNPTFQSTLPARGATSVRLSIIQASSNFNPRSPHGERPATDAATLGALLFQSTLPARGATTRSIEADGKREISIHAPRTGSDRNCPQR